MSSSGGNRNSVQSLPPAALVDPGGSWKPDASDAFALIFAVMDVTDDHFMREALKQARQAFDAGEVPVGAVVVWDGRIISRGHNQVEQLNDSTAHAEMIALTSAFSQLGSKYLPEAVLYVTVEPCLMCCGALYWAKVARIVYGAADVKNGYRRCTGDNFPFHPKASVIEGIMALECAQLMKDFFAARR